MATICGISAEFTSGMLRERQMGKFVELSVIIPCYNAAETLGLQLEALARQREAPAFEVLVVDNMSTWPPDEVVKQWAGSLPQLRLIRADEGQGVSTARNVGIREAATDYIVLCDADDVAGPSFVRAAWEGLQEAELVTGNVLTFDADQFASVDAVWNLLPEADTNYPVRFGVVDPEYPIVMGGACAMRREAAMRLRGFDAAYFPGAEDNDLALRAVNQGYQIAACPSMTLAERRRADASGAFRRSYEGGRMHMRLCAGHDLWKSSPHLRHPAWYFDLFKLPLAIAKVFVTGRRPSAVLAVAGRAGLRLGQARGFLAYRILRRPVEPRLGEGLGS